MNIEDVRPQYPDGWFDSRTPAEQQRILRKHEGWQGASTHFDPIREIMRTFKLPSHTSDMRHLLKPARR